MDGWMDGEDRGAGPTSIELPSIIHRLHANDIHLLNAYIYIYILIAYIYMYIYSYIYIHTPTHPPTHTHTHTNHPEGGHEIETPIIKLTITHTHPIPTKKGVADQSYKKGKAERDMIVERMNERRSRRMAGRLTHVLSRLLCQFGGLIGGRLQVVCVRAMAMARGPFMGG
jgi:hypothetical protein